MIQPTYVTYKQAVWLKEKGFDELCRQRWSIVENIDGDKSSFLQVEGGMFNWNNGTYPEFCSAPEQWLVIEWLRVNHGIWTGLSRYVNGYGEFYSANVQIIANKHHSANGHTSPQDAYSAAFDYIISNNLI